MNYKEKKAKMNSWMLVLKLQINIDETPKNKVSFKI